MRQQAAVIGISLKMHLGHRETIKWLTGFRDLATRMNGLPNLETFVLPGFLAIPIAQQVLTGTGIGWGAQDAFWERRGPFTGEVSVDDVRELGGSYVELGHAERRRIFGEDDAMVARKAAAVVAAGMTPVICVGELHEAGRAAAERACREQLAPVLAAIPEGARIIVAYEPVWAIGAAHPASAEHIEYAARDIRAFIGRPAQTLQVIYGGSAGPGLFGRLNNAIDGLFLGRSALDHHSLRQVLSEAVSLAAAPSRPGTSN